MPSLPNLDRATRLFWRTSGRAVDLSGQDRWLQAPMHDGSLVGDAWLEQAAVGLGGTLAKARPGAGLLADLRQLDGPEFRSTEIHPTIRDFYEHTSNWRMEVWTQWNPLFQPGGELISRLWGRRVQQLALRRGPSTSPTEWTAGSS